MSFALTDFTTLDDSTSKAVFDALDDALTAMPPWINRDIVDQEGTYPTLLVIHGIATIECCGGAYMPAVVYSVARDTMSEHGDDVKAYLLATLGEMPVPDTRDPRWNGRASFYLSLAVEAWARATLTTIGVEHYTPDWDVKCSTCEEVPTLPAGLCRECAPSA